MILLIPGKFYVKYSFLTLNPLELGQTKADGENIKVCTVGVLDRGRSLLRPRSTASEGKSGAGATVDSKKKYRKNRMT